MCAICTTIERVGSKPIVWGLIPKLVMSLECAFVERSCVDPDTPPTLHDIIGFLFGRVLLLT